LYVKERQQSRARIAQKKYKAAIRESCKKGWTRPLSFQARHMFFKQPLKQFNKVACMLAALLIMVA